MKHPKKIVFILLGMFLLTQLIGLLVISFYPPVTHTVVAENGSITNETTYNLPFGTNPPADINPNEAIVSIITAIIIAVVLMLVFIKFKVNTVLRWWFFIVVTMTIAITLNSPLLKLNILQDQITILSNTFPIAWVIALVVALPLAIIKIFHRNIIVHNLTELLVYPGIAVIFVPLLNIWTMVFLLILISLYDMYAVWHAGFMQKMAKYQIEKVKVFTGFFIPYVSKENKELMEKAKNSKKKNKESLMKKIQVPIAILGGGDVVFPIILAGVVFRALGIYQALIVALGATVALGLLFYYSEKGKFYPAMPFISAGCFVALGIIYLLQLFI